MFLNNTANNVKQVSENKMLFAVFNAHLLDRKQNDNLLELQIGNEFRKDKLVSTFSLLEDTVVLENPIGYQNNTNYQVNNSYIKSKYLLKINNVSDIATLNAHQLSNRLENRDTITTQNPFFINPSFGFNWIINKQNKITTSYAYNTTNANILDVFNYYIHTVFRSFYKAINSFNQLDATSFSLNYQLGNWDDRFFADTYVYYNKNFDFFSTNTTLNQNYTRSEKILVKNRETIGINTKLDYYFKFILSNFKVDLEFSKSDFLNSINNATLRNVTYHNYNYGFELRSGFSGFFNYHIGTKWNVINIKTTIDNSFTNNQSFLDLSFNFNDKFNVQLQSESYYFGNLATNITYYFLDMDANYKLIKNKLTLGITAKNLLNTQKFRNFSISDIGSSTTEYRLLPRFMLLKMEYRF